MKRRDTFPNGMCSTGHWEILLWSRYHGHSITLWETFPWTWVYSSLIWFFSGETGRNRLPHVRPGKHGVLDFLGHRHHGATGIRHGIGGRKGKSSDWGLPPPMGVLVVMSLNVFSSQAFAADIGPRCVQNMREIFGASGATLEKPFDQALRDILTLSELDVNIPFRHSFIHHSIHFCFSFSFCSFFWLRRKMKKVFKCKILFFVSFQGGTDVARLYIALSGFQYAGLAQVAEIQWGSWASFEWWSRLLTMFACCSLDKPTTHRPTRRRRWNESCLWSAWRRRERFFSMTTFIHPFRCAEFLTYSTVLFRS